MSNFELIWSGPSLPHIFHIYIHIHIYHIDILRMVLLMSAHQSHTMYILVVTPVHAEVEDCLRKKCLTSNTRQEIVRTVASQLFVRSQRPNRSDCDGKWPGNSF